ncbi:gliding motility-associated C-terminal domain-containing protein, partial [Flavobacterium orientale]|uniref:gliding motility-associated C-terminal domain-containing protein n=1 Tax=Flavobacterium orientale TaxID=1756020 RepID=UPI00166DF3ED
DAIPAAVTLTATDNCGDATVTFNESVVAGQCLGSSVITRTWTATDSCGNITTHVQTITVEDTTAPVFVGDLPQNATVQCDAIPAAVTLTATDNCGDATVTFNESVVAGQCLGSSVITRTWTATDSCGNAVSHVQVITVEDTTVPVFVGDLPQNATVQCDAIPAAVTLTATDNCGDATVTFNESVVAGQCLGSSVITRTWTATDSCGNAVSHVQVITVEDTTAPVFVGDLPVEELTVSCDAIPTPEVLTAVDSCGTATVTISEAIQDGKCPTTYTLIRTWTATDECGNSVSHTQSINVFDNTAPTFVEALPENETTDCDSIPLPVVLTAIDNCGETSVFFEESIVNGSCEGEYQIIRTWLAIDTCGNSVTHTQEITVEDNSAPVPVTQFESVINVSCDQIPVMPELEFTDTCSTEVDVVFTEETINQTQNSYTIVRSWLVSDSCGNSETYTQTVNVTVVSPIETLNSELCIEDDAIDLFSLLEQGIEQNGTWVDVDGSGGLQGNIFDPTLVSQTGDYKLQYVISDSVCPRIIEITMNVNDLCVVLPCQPIEVFNAMSPNGDGLNDVFYIENIDNNECYTDNTVEIYNRWGVLVFETRGYDNTTRVFRGVSEGRATLNKSAELPTGTYFYIIQYKTVEGSTVNKEGWLYLTR